MDAEQVVGKILSEANAEADKITGAAKDKCASQQAELSETLAAQAKETETLAADAGADKKSRMLAGARMELSKQYLAAKGVLLNKVFEMAADRVKGLSDKEYAELMGGLMEKAVETGDEEIVPGKTDARINGGLIKQVNRKLGPGFKGNLRLSNDKADIDGGFVLKRGNIKTNVSIEVLITMVRSELEMEIANEMFA
jgi:V/A-type H+-transporting ATPase subunit E